VCVCVCVCARASKSRATVAESGGLCWAQVYRCGFARPSINPIEFLPIHTHTHSHTYILYYIYRYAVAEFAARSGEGFSLWKPVFMG